VIAVITTLVLTTACAGPPDPGPDPQPTTSQDAAVTPGDVTELATGLRMPWG
jgi:hypothetical protein